MHGRYLKRFQNEDMDEEKSNGWLENAGLKSETGGLIVVAQDQALKIKYIQAKIIKNGIDPNCRMWTIPRNSRSHNIWIP